MSTLTSMTTSTEPAGTGRERIVEAALLDFAEQGYGGASIRRIAARADVSPALVQHHFGTKQGLRDACDLYVLEAVLGSRDPGTLTAYAQVSGFAALSDAVYAYVSRALADDSELARRLFAAMLEVIEADLAEQGYSESDGDLRAVAVAIATMQLGPMALHRLIRHSLDPAASSTHNLGRVGLAMLALINPALQSPESTADQAAAYRALMTVDEVRKD